MSILLPTFPAPQSAEPYFLDAGGVQKSIAGGEDMRLDRLGDRFGLSVSLIPMRWHDLTTAEQTRAARVWVARLIQGLSQGAILPFPQPGFRPPGGTCYAGYPTQSGASQVTLYNLAGATTVLEGQFLTHIRAATGRRYLYQVRADTVLPGNGYADLPLWPRIRGPMGTDDVLEFAKPTIEGLVRGEQQSWSLAVTRLAGIQFKLEERG